MTERKPTFYVLSGNGLNCEQETATALRQAGAKANIVHLSQLEDPDGVNLARDSQGLVIPGGFSAGDAVRAGVVLARRLQARSGEQIQDLADRWPILGICNGFQALIGLGLLPEGEIGATPAATLAGNSSGRFECRWVNLRPNKSSVSPIVPRGMPDVITLPVANGEGRFVAAAETLDRLHRNGQIVLQYCDEAGQPTLQYPQNPSGSQDGIAAISNESGLVIGSMPHPERFTSIMQHPNWRRPEAPAEPHGLSLIRNIVAMAAQS